MAGMTFGFLGQRLTMLAVVALAFVPYSARADKTVGYIAAHTGAVTSGPSSAYRRNVQTGSPIVVRDRLISDATGRAEIEFRDGIRLAMGPATDLGIRSYLLDPDFSVAGVIDLFDGAVRAEVPGDLRDTLAFQTNTAAIVGNRAVWTVIAEEENTLVVVHSGTVHVQQLDIGRGPVGPVIDVKASFGLEIPALGPVAAPRKLSETEIEAIGRRLTPRNRTD